MCSYTIATAKNSTSTPYSGNTTTGINSTYSSTTAIVATTPVSFPIVGTWERISGSNIVIIAVSVTATLLILLVLGYFCIRRQKRSNRAKESAVKQICQTTEERMSDTLHFSISTNLSKLQDHSMPSMVNSTLEYEMEQGAESINLSKPPFITQQANSAQGFVKHYPVSEGNPAQASAGGPVIDASFVFESSCGSGVFKAYKPGKPDSIFAVMPESTAANACLAFESSSVTNQPTAVEPREVFTAYSRQFDSKPSKSVLLLWKLRKQLGSERGKPA